MGKHRHRLLTSSDDGTGVCKYCGPVSWALIQGKRVCGQTAYLKPGKVGSELTLEQARQFRQDRPCEICGAPFVDGKGGHAADHNHRTGVPRGVLCARCNKGLGWLEDSEWVDAAMSYLSRYATTPPEM
jgi:hypothetical protein